MAQGDAPAAHPIYPVGLRLSGRRVVVVGGGPVAERRARGLVDAGAEVVVLSSSLTPGLRDLLDVRALTWWDRRYADGDLAGAWYVVAATSSGQVNAAIQAEAERLRIFCVRADDAAKSSTRTHLCLPGVATRRGADRRVGASGRQRRSGG